MSEVDHNLQNISKMNPETVAAELDGWEFPSIRNIENVTTTNTEENDDGSTHTEQR
jgi:hypothetical protein